MPKKKTSKETVTGILPPTTKEQVQERIGWDEGPLFYANTMEVRVSVVDFRLRLSEILDATPDRIRVRETARIYLSPQHAKGLADILVRHLAEYEKRFGQIPAVKE